MTILKKKHSVQFLTESGKLLTDKMTIAETFNRLFVDPQNNPSSAETERISDLSHSGPEVEASFVIPLVSKQRVLELF